MLSKCTCVQTSTEIYLNHTAQLDPGPSHQCDKYYNTPTTRRKSCTLLAKMLSIKLALKLLMQGLRKRTFSDQQFIKTCNITELALSSVTSKYNSWNHSCTKNLLYQTHPKFSFPHCVQNPVRAEYKQQTNHPSEKQHNKVSGKINYLLRTQSLSPMRNTQEWPLQNYEQGKHRPTASLQMDCFTSTTLLSDLEEVLKQVCQIWNISYHKTMANRFCVEHELCLFICFTSLWHF